MKKNTYTGGGAALTELVLEIFRFNGLILGAGDRLTAEFNLTSARWQVMGALEEGPLPAAHIARRMGLQRQSVQRVVDILLAEGLLTTEENPNHRRAKLILLSEAGRKKLQAVTEAWTGLANEMSEGMDEKQITRATTLLKTIAKRIPG